MLKEQQDEIKKVTISQCQTIINLSRHTNFSRRVIAKKAKVSGHTVSATCKCFALHGTLKDLPLHGRKRKTTELENQCILHVACQYPFQGAKAIKHDAHLWCSTHTVCHRLKHMGVPPCIAWHKPILNPCHIQARLRWCNDHWHWSVNQWW